MRMLLQACLALPELAEQFFYDPADSIWEGHGVQSVSTAFSHSLKTFDREITQLILPSFLQAGEGVAIDMIDGRFEAFGFCHRPDPNRWRAELHLFYLQFTELTNGCACCGAFNVLWDCYVQAEVSGNVTKQRLPTLLDAWAEWGQCQTDMCQHAQ